MDSYLNTEMAEKSSKKAHRIQIANKLIDTLMNLEQNFDLNQRRWIWELLQNAKDIAYKSKVDVKIELTPETLTFSHTGRPFKAEDLVFLIEQTSSKDRKSMNNSSMEEESKMVAENENEDQTGKFGTGFITTHLLSKKVKINGIFEEDNRKKRYKDFEMILDRDTFIQKEMIKKIEKSFDIFKTLDNTKKLSSEQFQVGVHYSTNFTYILDERGLEVAETGINDFNHSILLTMLFNKEITRIRVHDKIRKIKRKYKYNAEESIVYDENQKEKISLECLEMEENHKKTIKKYLMYTGEYVQTVIELGQNEEGVSFIVPKDPLAPVIFVDFPLIGSHDFPFACYFNSHLFSPNEPRSGLFIKGDFKEVKMNKSLLKALNKQTKKMIQFICSPKNPKIIYNRHLLVNTSIPQDFDEEWYRENIQKNLRELIYNEEIIENDQQKYIKLIESIIPFAEEKYILDLHDLISPIFKTNIIKKDLDYLLYWTKEFNDNWQKSLNVKNLFDIYSLFDFINGKKEVKELTERLNFEEEADVFSWLNNIFVYMHATISKNECDKILNTYALIPNQHGILCHLSSLAQDEEIPDVLKEILFKLGQDIRSRLMNVNITMNCQEGWDIFYVSGLIDKYYDSIDTDETLLTDASLDILNLVPSNKKQDKEAKSFRENFQEVAKAFFKHENGVITVNFNNDPLYTRAENYILMKILVKLEVAGNIRKLALNLEVDEKKALILLNDFYQLAFLKNWRTDMSKSKIFPNYSGVFKLAKDLKIDQIKNDLEIEYGNLNDIEEEKYDEFDMRREMNERIFNTQSEKIANNLKDIYRRINPHGEESIESLLHPSIRLNDYRLIPKEFHLKDIANSFEMFLKEKKGTISENDETKKIIKDLYECIKMLSNPIKKKYFQWLESNWHSILVETTNSNTAKSIIMDVSLLNDENDLKIIKKLMVNDLTKEDILRLIEKNKLKFDNPFQFPEIPRNNNTTLNEDFSELDIPFIADNPNSLNVLKNSLINYNLTTEEQFKSLLENKKIMIPSSFQIPKDAFQDAFQYVKKILETAKEKVLEHLKTLPYYDLSSATYDQYSPNKNILINVRKNGIKIHIVVRPSDNKKIVIHSDREILELDDPINELWFSDGIRTRQMTLGQIFRSSDMRIIKI